MTTEETTINKERLTPSTKRRRTEITFVCGNLDGLQTRCQRRRRNGRLQQRPKGGKTYFKKERMQKTPALTKKASRTTSLEVSLSTFTASLILMDGTNPSFPPFYKREGLAISGKNSVLTGIRVDWARPDMTMKISASPLKSTTSERPTRKAN